MKVIDISSKFNSVQFKILFHQYLVISIKFENMVCCARQSSEPREQNLRQFTVKVPKEHRLSTIEPKFWKFVTHHHAQMIVNWFVYWYIDENKLQHEIMKWTSNIQKQQKISPYPRKSSVSWDVLRSEVRSVGTTSWFYLELFEFWDRTFYLCRKIFTPIGGHLLNPLTVCLGLYRKIKWHFVEIKILPYGKIPVLEKVRAQNWKKV